MGEGHVKDLVVRTVKVGLGGVCGHFVELAFIADLEIVACASILKGKKKEKKRSTRDFVSTTRMHTWLSLQDHRVEPRSNNHIVEVALQIHIFGEEWDRN